MEALPVYVLAGGHSSRFGSDKARACIDHEPLILRLARVLQPLARRLLVVADRPHKYDDLGLVTIADRRPGLGPIGGLHTALCDQIERDESGWLLLCACDLLEVRPQWIEELRGQTRPGVQVVAFRAERWQPLLALYHTAIEPQVRQRIATGRRALWSLLESVASVGLPLPEGCPDPLQANTPNELLVYARSRARQSV